MRRSEVIEQTLKDMGCFHSMTLGNTHLHANRDEYDATVTIPELKKRLPDTDIVTCEQIHINVNCCNTCHSFYPHYDMYLVDLPDNRKAWICCAVHSALFGDSR